MNAMLKFQNDVIKELHDLHSKAENLSERCESLSMLNGMSKLFRKCKAELQFLNRIMSNKCRISPSHLLSSNLAHLEGILQGVEALSGVSQVLGTFRIPDVDHPVCVDIICDHGRTWVKVVARNSKALLLDSTNQHAYGEKTILDQAKLFQEAANIHPHNYAVPHIAFLFFHDVPEKLHDDLNKLGITVWNHNKLSETKDSSVAVRCDEMQICSSSAVTFSDNEAKNSYCACQAVESNAVESGDSVTEHCDSSVSSLKSFCADSCICALSFKEGSTTSAELSFTDPSIQDIGRVNLDITTLFALVTNLCHGHCDLVFQEKILTQQAAEERCDPLLPELLNFLIGKQLFVCETALSDFHNILSIVGGPHEMERARCLLQYLQVVPDCPSPRSLKLCTTPKLSSRAKIIFGTGDHLKAVTTTANQGFVRAASQSSVDFVVFAHSARALTEQKEHTAVSLLL